MLLYAPGPPTVRHPQSACGLGSSAGKIWCVSRAFHRSGLAGSQSGILGFNSTGCNARALVMYGDARERPTYLEHKSSRIAKTMAGFYKITKVISFSWKA